METIADTLIILLRKTVDMEMELRDNRNNLREGQIIREQQKIDKIKVATSIVNAMYRGEVDEWIDTEINTHVF